MDIQLYDNIFSGLETFIEAQSNIKKPNIKHYQPAKPTYPLVIVSEVRYDTLSNAKVGRQTTSSVGYQVEIYAKLATGGTETHQDTARKIAERVNYYMTNYVGLAHISKNEFPNVDGDNQLYRVVLMYATQYFENKKIIY